MIPDESTIALILQEGREREREKIVNWLNRQCDYGPPCGKCTYCVVARTIADPGWDRGPRALGESV